jgi:hypothetical protein
MRSLLLPALMFAAAGSVLAAGTANAQILDGGIGTTALSDADFFIGVQHQPGANLSDFDVARFFNKRNCDCAEPIYVYVALTDSGFAKKASVDHNGSLEIWIGSDCANTSLRDQRCVKIDAPTTAAFLIAGRDTIMTDARVMSTYTLAGAIDGGVVGNFTPNPTCTTPGIESFDQTIWVLQNTNGTPMSIKTRAVHIDLTPPPPPDSDQISVSAGNQAVVINWPGVNSAITTDLLGYQVLCNRGGELQVFSDNTFGAGFQSCPATTTGTGVQGLDTKFICSPLLRSTSRSFRVKILQNDITYGVAVVAIDNSGNASVPDVFYGTPIKTKSFYDVYRDDDPDHPGTVTGGLCTLAAARSSCGAALAGLGGFALVTIVIARRRRRR